jgi:hypothetical protein
MKISYYYDESWWRSSMMNIIWRTIDKWDDGRVRKIGIKFSLS